MFERRRLHEITLTFYNFLVIIPRLFHLCKSKSEGENSYNFMEYHYAPITAEVVMLLMISNCIKLLSI